MKGSTGSDRAFSMLGVLFGVLPGIGGNGENGIPILLMGMPPYAGQRVKPRAGR